MTTVRLSRRIECDILEEYWNNEKVSNFHKSGSNVLSNGKSRLDYFMQYMVIKMEQEDTFSDYIIGYGLAGLTLLYLFGHILRVLF
ncbi:MAG: hypothetical protein HGA27_03245 [Peptococcaceae bacterium]|nr:hypothetical protein [Peptococcaceae bacterium]